VSVLSLRFAPERELSYCEVVTCAKQEKVRAAPREVLQQR